MNLGETILYNRKQRGLNVKDLAEQIGISSSMLSQIERNNANPSINTLRAISSALAVPLYSFFINEEEIGSYVVRKNERKTIGNFDGLHYPLELLTPNTSGNIEFCIMTMAPDISSDVEATCHDGEEVGYMLQGELVLEIDGETVTIAEGDSLRIPPRTRHIWHNKSNGIAKFIFAINPPTF